MKNLVGRYLSVFKRNVLLGIIIIALIISSSLTKGKTATTLSILAGIAMIYAGITFFIWIIKTPAKKNKDEVT